MKFTTQKIREGEAEVILRYRERTLEVERICSYFQSESLKLRGFKEQTQVLLEPAEILYIESVDGKTFAYTEAEVYLKPFGTVT